MDLKSLEKRIKKLRDYAGTHNRGKMFTELGGGMPFHNEEKPYPEKGIFIHNRNSPGADQEINIILNHKDNKPYGYDLQDCFRDFLALIKPKGENNCSFCNSKSSKVYKIKKGLFSSDYFSFCILCQLLIDDDYLEYDFYDTFSGLGSGDVNSEYKHNSDRSYLQGGYLDDYAAKNHDGFIVAKPDGGGPNHLKSDLNNNFSEVRAKIMTKREKALNKIEEIITAMENAIPIARERSKKTIKEWRKQEKKLKDSIINLLKEKAVKMPASDIDAFLKHQNVDEIKSYCEDMYHNGEISRTANYRYFILSEEKKESKKASVPKSEEVDVEKELEKLKGLLDKGLITQEQYDAKSNKLLGL